QPTFNLVENKSFWGGLVEPVFFFNNKCIVNRKRHGNDVGCKHNNAEKQKCSQYGMRCNIPDNAINKRKTVKSKHGQSNQKTKRSGYHSKPVIFTLVVLLPGIFFFVVNSFQFTGELRTHSTGIQILQIIFKQKIENQNGNNYPKNNFVHS